MNGRSQNLTNGEKCDSIEDKPDSDIARLVKVLVRILKFAITLLSKEFP